jgi:TrmH family RNA methyltransferase
LQQSTGSVVTSRGNPRVKYALRLAASAAARAEEGLFFAEGVRLCLDLAQCLKPEVVFATEAALTGVPKLRQLGGELVPVAEGVAEKLAVTGGPQGVFALFPLPDAGWDSLRPARGLLLCEALQDPANVGAVVRTAAGLGLGGVVLAAGGGLGAADPTNPKALRASMGALARLPVVCAGDSVHAAARLKAAGVRLIAAAARGGVLLEKERNVAPFALMLGNEGAGLSEALLAAADVRVAIPMHNGVESLNVAAAAAIMMYALGSHQGGGCCGK